MEEIGVRSVRMTLIKMRMLVSGLSISACCLPVSVYDNRSDDSKIDATFVGSDN